MRRKNKIFEDKYSNLTRATTGGVRTEGETMKIQRTMIRYWSTSYIKHVGGFVLFLMLVLQPTYLFTSCKSSERKPDPTAKAITVTFDLLSNYDYDREQIPDLIKSLDRQKVAITGFMLPIDFNGGKIKSFLLLPNQMACCFGMTPKENQFIQVDMIGNETAKYMPDLPITVVGKLEVGKKLLVNSVYRIEADGVLVTDADMRSALAGFDFRNTRWGMTKSAVKVTEFGQPVEDKDDLLTYTDVVGGDMDVLVAYFFSQGKLVRGKYLFYAEHTNKDDYISYYNKYKEIMNLKYGPSKSDQEIWRDSLYRGKPEKLGLALSLGHLAYRSKWENETTEIILTLHENKKKILFGVIYSSKKAGPLKELSEEEGKNHSG
jgi:hypothetical protein